jgi:hypothetical protein
VVKRTDLSGPECLGLIVVVTALLAVWVWVVQWAWNAIVPAVFGGPTIEYWQAAAVLVLVSLFNGVRSGKK